MKHLVFIGLAVVALVLAAATLGGDAPLRLAENAPSAASEEASIHGYGAATPTCEEWTDGCRTCSRPGGGGMLCSNMPIACQPVAITCARKADPAKAELPKSDPPKPN
jgi:hypothetical protein